MPEALMFQFFVQLLIMIIKIEQVSPMWEWLVILVLLGATVFWILRSQRVQTGGCSGCAGCPLECPQQTDTPDKEKNHEESA
jgi:hypothetical protein